MELPGTGTIFTRNLARFYFAAQFKARRFVFRCAESECGVAFAIVIPSIIHRLGLLLPDERVFQDSRRTVSLYIHTHFQRTKSRACIQPSRDVLNRLRLGALPIRPGLRFRKFWDRAKPHPLG